MAGIGPSGARGEAAAPDDEDEHDDSDSNDPLTAAGLRPPAARTSALDLPPGHLIAGRYSVVRKLGEGNMGVVFLARDTTANRRAAVKLLHPELILDGRITERFAREAKAASDVKHPNIVEVFGAGSDSGRMYLAMEFLDGETLRERITASAPLSPAQVVPVVERIASALAALHERDIIHRDVKPDNIHLHEAEPGAPPVPKLLDFGLAKGDNPGAERLTRTGTSIGTPMYMAPEQAHGARHVTGAADQYALAVILYEALSGEFPHVAANYYSLMLAKLSTPPYPLDELRPDLPKGLVDAVMKGMSREPSERYPSVEAFRQALLPYKDLELKAPPRDKNAPRKAIADPVQVPGPAVGPGVAPPQPIALGTMGASAPAARPMFMSAPAPAPVHAPSGVKTGEMPAVRPSRVTGVGGTASVTPRAPSVVSPEPVGAAEQEEQGLSRGALLAVVGGVVLGVLVVVGVALARKGSHPHGVNGAPPSSSASVVPPQSASSAPR